MKPLQKTNTTSLALSSFHNKTLGDGVVNDMFDAGNGPQIEEWTLPTHAGHPCATSMNVSTDFSL